MLNRLKQIFHINPQKEGLSVYEKIDNLFDSLNDEIIKIKMGEDVEQFRDIICKITENVRNEIKEECGFILPPVRISSDYECQENELKIMIAGRLTAEIYVVPTEKGIEEEVYESFKTCVYENIDYIFTGELAERYLNRVQRNNSWLIWNITNVLSIVDIKTILVDILKNGKRINNINYIFEQIGENVLQNGDYRDCLKKYNPHSIAIRIVQTL